MKIKAGIIKFRDALKNFFSSSKGRDVILYIIFVIIASVFWALLALNKNVQDNFHVSFAITDIPRDVTLIDNYPTHIDVIVKNSGYEILSYKMIKDLNVKAKFSSFAKEGGVLSISSQEIQDLLLSKLGNEASIVSFAPDNIKVNYTDLPGKKVPVKINGSFVSNFQYVVNGNIISTPDSVLVFGDEDVLNIVTQAETETVVRNELKDTLNLSVGLKTIPNSRFIPGSVNVSVPVEPLVLQKVNVTLTTANCKQNTKLVLFPSYVTVDYYAPLSKIDYNVSNQLKLVVDYNLIQENTTKLPIIVENVPDFCRNITLSTDSVEFILEQ